MFLGGAVHRFVTRYPLWSVWLLALAARAVYVLITEPDPYTMIDSGEYDVIARNMLEGRGYGPVFVPWLRPPVYPLFLAAVYATGGIILLQILQIVLGATTAVLVGLVARLLHAKPNVVWVAALVAALYPWFFSYVGGIASETLFTFLAVVSLAMVLLAAHQRSLRLTLAAGLVFGLAALTRTNILVMAPGVALWWLWRSRSMIQPAVFTAAIIATLLPFTIFNLAQGNGLVISSNGGGWSFYLGHNPESTRHYDGSMTDAEWLEGHSSGPLIDYLGCIVTEQDLIHICPEVPAKDLDAFFYRAGLRYISEHPVEAFVTDVKKMFHYWRPWVDPRAYPASIVLVTGVSFGLVLLFAIAGVRGMRKDAAAFVLGIAAFSTLQGVLWHVQLRYRFAMLDPVLIATAAGPLASWVQGVAYALASAMRERARRASLPLSGRPAPRSRTSSD